MPPAVTTAALAACTKHTAPAEGCAFTNIQTRTRLPPWCAFTLMVTGTDLAGGEALPWRSGAAEQQMGPDRDGGAANGADKAHRQGAVSTLDCALSKGVSHLHPKEVSRKSHLVQHLILHVLFRVITIVVYTSCSWGWMEPCSADAAPLTC